MPALTKFDYQQAQDSQSACNLCAIVKAFARVMDRIFEDNDKLGLGSDGINNHPICKMYATQIEHLTRDKDYFVAANEIERKLKELEQAQNTTTTPNVSTN